MNGVIYLNKDKKTDSVPEKETTKEPKKLLQQKPKAAKTSTEKKPNPVTDTKIEAGAIFSPYMTDYLQRYKKALQKEKQKPENPLYVDEIASKIAKIYEKVRRVIDWKEEHLVRRTSIERILKRRLISEISEITVLPDLDPEKIARPMILEIIRTGYFENRKIGEGKIDEIAKILKKYIYILKNSPYAKESALAIKNKVHFYNWLLEIAACEIDETLEYPYKEIALLDFMTDSMYENIVLEPEGKLSEEDKYIQTYIAVHRTLYNLDKPIITYHVIKEKYPAFVSEDNSESTFPQEFTENIESIWHHLEEDLTHPKRGEFQRLCEKYDAAYRILADVMKQLEAGKAPLEQTLAKKDKLLSTLEETYKERLSTLKARLFRSAIYSTLSIFVAGAASLFVFEYPIAKLFYGEFSPWAIVADIMIPTALMFILVGIIRPPVEDNLEKLKEEVQKIVYSKKEREKYHVKLQKRIKKVQNVLFTLIYLTGGLGSLYFIYWIFKIARVPLTSLYIDTVNVAVVVFAAMVIRQKSKEITIKERSSLFEFFLDFFSVPLAKIGRWLNNKWKEFNFVSVFFSTLIDMPFSTFLEFLEGWRNYIKEKRAEIQ